MESRPEVDRAAAQAALGEVSSMHEAADRRARPPRWYIPSLAVLIFLVFAVQALPLVIRAAAIVLALVGEGVLIGAYRSVTGINPWRRKMNRRMVPAVIIITVVAAGLSFGAMTMAESTGQRWWCVLAGLIGSVLVLVLSRFTDPVRDVRQVAR